MCVFLVLVFLLVSTQVDFSTSSSLDKVETLSIVPGIGDPNTFFNQILQDPVEFREQNAMNNRNITLKLEL
ncbi:unnamed protein product [Leptosia nina]|uniref:Uncharacterized protein n=1 Tax=Leptosia nina TaxID=320188 RepID=A0AAV1IYV5_9NEOP